MHAALLIDERLQQLQFGFRKLHLHSGASHELTAALSPCYLDAAVPRASVALVCVLTSVLVLALTSALTSPEAPFPPWTLKSSNFVMSSRMISRPLCFPNPVTHFSPPSRNSVGEGSTSAAGILSTSDAESTIRPESRPLCSSTRIRLRRLGATLVSPSRFRRSCTDTILPRRLITPSIYAGASGTAVISGTRTISCSEVIGAP